MFRILITAVFASLLWTTTKISENETAVDTEYPSLAVAYLQESGLADERGYNTYIWGGYLIWHDIPVFIDGRADVYGDDFMEYYMQTFNVTQSWREPLDEYAVQYVLTDKYGTLAVLLETDMGWESTYVDELAQIFIRIGK